VQQVLVLNSGYEPLNVCTVRRAYVLVLKGRAELIEKDARPLRSASDTYPRPHVIRLLAYVHIPRSAKRKISRSVLFARDGWRCGYCGSSTGKLTLDHIVPRSRGGESVWENVVASCAPCNRRKGDRLLTETEMALRVSPRPPAPVVFIRLAATTVPANWRPYLRNYEFSPAA
jgi:5-methylcytosine-specific restriction endonuclease McrA